MGVNEILQSQESDISLVPRLPYEPQYEAVAGGFTFMILSTEISIT